MASVVYIAEVAAILTVAYGLGWVIGYVMHRVLAGKPVVAAVVPAERIAAVTTTPEAVALVKAPVIEPVPSARPPASPTAPAPEPVAAPPEVVAAESVPEAVASAEPMPVEPVLAPVAIPVVAPPPPMNVDPVPAPAKPVDPEPAPAPEPEPEVILTATPAMKPGEAWSGEIRGRAAAPVIAEAANSSAEPAGDSFEPPPTETPLTIDLGPVGPDSTYGEPVMPQPAAEADVEAPAAIEPPAEEIPTPAPPPAAPAKPLDEDAAMRAIEGGWSRVRTRALPGSPELADVGAAVAAAQTAVEQVLAKAGIDTETSGHAARPKGLPRARNGKKDDLKQINGLGALDESTLNNLGVFHFDQIAGWTEAQVLWMENHVFARGRIGRENWQQQARERAAVTG